MLVKMETGGGGTPITSYSGARNNVTTGTITYNDLDTSKVYIVFIWGSSSASLPYNKYDGFSMSNGTLTKFDNLYNSSFQTAGTYYYLVPTNSSVTITAPSGINSWQIELITPN